MDKLVLLRNAVTSPSAFPICKSEGQWLVGARLVLKVLQTFFTVLLHWKYYLIWLLVFLLFFFFLSFHNIFN